MANLFKDAGFNILIKMSTILIIAKVYYPLALVTNFNILIKRCRILINAKVYYPVALVTVMNVNPTIALNHPLILNSING